MSKQDHGALIEAAREVGARRTYLTHLTHRVTHAELLEKLGLRRQRQDHVSHLEQPAGRVRRGGDDFPRAAQGLDRLGGVGHPVSVAAAGLGLGVVAEDAVFPL